jgi:hypothetical protein
LLTAPASAKTTTVTFEKPGRYTIVARPKLDGVGPWSAPITVDVVAPFDLVSAPGFSASRAPKYVLKGDVRAALPKGSKLKVSIAKGRKGGKFSPLKKIKTGKGGKFKLRFKLSDPGSYRIRYAFRGSKTVAAGRVTQLIKVKKVNI